MKFIFEFIKILTSRQRYNLLIIQILIVIMSLFELISIISIAPFMTILTDPNLIYSNQSSVNSEVFFLNELGIKVNFLLFQIIL